MYTIILNQYQNDSKPERNTDKDSINAFLVGSGLNLFLGSFVPDGFNGNPYRHFAAVQSLAADQNIILTMDNSSILVYGMLSGTLERHNNLVL